MTTEAPDYFAADTYDAEVPGSRNQSGTTELAAVPGSAPLGRNPEPDAGRPLYGDVAALLAGGIPAPPEPAVLACSDDVALFYTGQVNHVFGDPESGKTWLCLAAVASELAAGRRAAVVDLDHNGMAATVSRLVDLGASKEALADPARFRYAEPEDRWHLLAIVSDLASWRAHVIVVDSLGELLPLFGASSNSPDDYTKVNTATLVPLARSGAAVIVIDHLAKNTDSRAMGATGTAAKKRSFGGVSLRVAVVDQFVKGQGGSARVTIAKDRHGGLRAYRPSATGNNEPLAAMFRLHPDSRYTVSAPTGSEPAESNVMDDVAELRQMDPPPSSVTDVAQRMTWRRQRAADALREFRRLDRSTCPVCREPMDPAAGDTHPTCEVAA
ncbi:hypothetical protein [Isoptericola sp. NPDC055881]